MPKGIVVHWVGNAGSAAINNRNYFERGSDGRKVSYHYIVGLEGEIIQCVPENERAAHAGPDSNPVHIGIGVCHPDWAGRFSDITFRALIELASDICARHGFNADKCVLRHFDITRKECPLYYVRNVHEWANLKNAVTAAVKFAVKPEMAPPADNHINILQRLDIIGADDNWRTSKIPWLSALFEKAAAPGVLDKNIDNGIPDLETALSVLADAGVINTPEHWRIVTQAVQNVDTLLISMANRARIVLEKIIHAEARGESPEGQILVGNVIINRHRSPRFPNGIYNVVFAPGQFTPITDGSYKIAAPSSSVKKAVDAVLDGQDSSRGALFFCTRASAVQAAAQARWPEGGPHAPMFLFELGNHRFYRD